MLFSVTGTKISEIINLKEDWIYFGSQLVKFQSMVRRPGHHGPVTSWQTLMVGVPRGTSCLPHGRKEIERQGQEGIEREGERKEREGEERKREEEEGGRRGGRRRRAISLGLSIPLQSTPQ